MSFQIPFPTFDDIQKSLQFWIDQQDKWFYFETDFLQSGTTAESDVPNPLRGQTKISRAMSYQTTKYIQTRIVGKIFDVVSYPPSLLLSDVRVITVKLTFEGKQNTICNASEQRERYGLVFSQITYYEPITSIESFLDNDKRINDQ